MTSRQRPYSLSSIPWTTISFSTTFIIDDYQCSGNLSTPNYAVQWSQKISPFPRLDHHDIGQPLDDSAARYHRLMYLSLMISLSFLTKSMHHASMPSHWFMSPGGWIDHPSSSKVQFAFALFRSIDVDTRLSSWSGPPRETGTIWSRVGNSSQYAGWVSFIFQLR